MIYTLIGTFAAGICGAGFVLMLRFLYKERIPKGAAPVAGGLFMLAATIGSEYSWYPNTIANLPDVIEVVTVRDQQNWYRPWTFVAPYVTAFVAIDRSSTRTNDAVPDIHLLNFYLFQRFNAVVEMPTLVDCAERNRANVIDGLEFDDDGRPVDVQWTAVAGDDALVQAACDETEAAAS
jgi:hypothetical protein